MSTAAKLESIAVSQPRLEPGDILTPQQLAERLQVSRSWVFEQTRRRAKARNKRPLPCIRLGKYLRFSWVQVCDWMAQKTVDNP
jgi:predicted DNA-binding transcriptional regulator AlpA